MSEFKVITQPFVSLTVLSDSRELGVDKRYAKDIRIIDFKNKLELMTGYLASDMKLKLLNKERKLVCNLDDDMKMLGFYPAEDGYFVQVEAHLTAIGAPIGEEDPNFKRFELTDEEYAKKKGTIKEFKLRNKLGQYSDSQTQQSAQKEKIESEKRAIDQIKLGSRCKVATSGAPTRLGTVMYLGQLENKSGYFVGIRYDEPLGKNDGSVDGSHFRISNKFSFLFFY
jgi:tubulin-specific chaperone B